MTPKSVLSRVLLLTLALALPLCAQNPPEPSSPESAPLSEDEIKSLILFTERFTLQVEAERILREALAREQEFAAKERAIAAREIETERARTALAEKEAADQKERADFYAASFKQVTQKKGFGCTMKKIFTLGMGACL